MTTNTELSTNTREAMEIIQNVQAKGWVSEKENQHTQAKLRALGFNVVEEVTEDSSQPPATDTNGRTFFEVSIHPFVEQIADEQGELVDGDWSNASGGEFSYEFGEVLDGYPDAIFRKGWSVSSWVRDGDDDDYGSIDVEDDEEFPDYATALARAEELAAKYRVGIDHRY